MGTRKQPYLTSQQLAAELEESQSLGRPTEKACEYFRLIATRLLGDWRYRNYPRDMQDDMVSAALEKCVRNIKNYKPQYKDRCFNYFTRAAEHAIWETLRKHYRHVNLVRKATLDFADELERTSPEAARRIRESQIEVERTKDKVTYKKKK